MNTTPSRVVALDVGSVRIGVAITDPSRILATPRGFIPYAPPPTVAHSLSTLLADDWSEVRDIVVGVPISLNGSESQTAIDIREWGSQLGEISRLPVHFIDERFTTVEAWRRLHEVGIDSRRGKHRIDGAAAAVILETWLAQQDTQP